MSVSPAQIQKLLNPTSIAVVGARENSFFGNGFMKNLENFDGDVYMVNPNRDTLFGRKSYPSIGSIGKPIDHASILVNAKLVIEILKDCAANGVKSVTVIAEGFAEAGPEGIARGKEVKQFCDDNSIALIGPNCYGFNNYVTGSYPSRYTVDVAPVAGGIGAVVHSGMLGQALQDAAFTRGVPLRYLVSSGNELVTDTNDFFEFYLEDPGTKVIVAELENIPEPQRFARIARQAVELGKPIVVFKTGSSAAASRIAVAHTGSITGSDAIADEFLRDLGVIRVESLEELAETAGLLVKGSWPEGERVGYVGFSGGGAEIFADMAEGTEIVLEPYSAETAQNISNVTGLPVSAIHNPLDTTVEKAGFYAEIIEQVAADPEIDIIISYGMPERSFGTNDPDGSSQMRIDALREAGKKYNKHVLFHESSDFQPSLGVFGEPQPDVPPYALGYIGIRAIGNTIAYGKHRRRILAQEQAPARAQADRPQFPVLPSAAGPLSEVDSKGLLEAYGIPVTKDVVVNAASAAGDAAEKIGYPVVLKVVAKNVAHKSDVGGVVLNLNDRAAVESAYDSILTSVTGAVPDANITGISVTHQASGGLEFIAGITSDVSLGSVVVLGMGGIYVEILKDSVLLRPPFTKQAALESIDKLRSAALLHGARGEAARDRDAIADVLVKLGNLALDFDGKLSELDINPLFVFPEGEGVLAADALVMLNEDSEPGDDSTAQTSTPLATASAPNVNQPA